MLSFVAASVLVPFWYPAPIPVTAPNGSVMHGPDGRVLVHRDMTKFNKAMIPAELALVCMAVCAAWLVLRLFRLLYGRRIHKKTVV
jgi:hypothetical protein